MANALWPVCAAFIAVSALPATAMTAELEDVLACVAFERGLNEMSRATNTSDDDAAYVENLARWNMIIDMTRGDTTDAEIEAEVGRVMENNAAMLDDFSRGEDTVDADGYEVGQSIQQYSSFCWQTELKYLPE